jgi:hypothetical protein
MVNAYALRRIMIKKEINIIDLLKTYDFLEALVIKYEYVQKNSQFEIIIGLVDWTLKKGYRHFKKIQFQQVKDWHREFGGYAPAKNINFNYYSKNETASYVIQNFNFIIKDEDTVRIMVSLGSSFGKIEFEADKKINLYSKIALGIKVGEGEWIYEDIENKEKFDFYEPF